MPFKIERNNEVKAEVILSVQEWATGELAFRAAMDNVTLYITDHWDAGAIPGEDGPDNVGLFKIFIERRPGRAEVRLRYDYPVVDDQTTNDIIWKVVPS